LIDPILAKDLRRSFHLSDFILIFHTFLFAYFNIKEKTLYRYALKKNCFKNFGQKHEIIDNSKSDKNFNLVDIANFKYKVYLCYDRAD